MRKKDGGVVQMRHEILARKIVEESVVLLKNEEQVLPFAKNQKAAFFGRSQPVSYTHLDVYKRQACLSD